ncbi:S66 peptidase family protein [Fictibacillus iocasae]|uniref:S66 peptidase family protein n=1 Tax=Fictibacillus iocasae TaxID=2715437 RepID=A0ABW2NMT1_9BACL
MIRYPFLKEGATIGVTAPSSGVPEDLHKLVEDACHRVKSMGYHVLCGNTVWTQNKVRSSSARFRADEFNTMMQDETIHLIFPPWGGELLIEMLEYIDFDNIQNKWIVGYSDISLLLLAITLKTGMATAHGTNFVDLRGDYSDETTLMWRSVLSTKKGGSILQHSSKNYQKEWQYDKPSPYVFHLNEPTHWNTVSNQSVKIQGRLLGGCMDSIRHIIGTPYGDVAAFRKNHLYNEPVIWFLENCEMLTTELRRTLVQMKLAGWFDQCSGIVFGRNPASTSVNGYTVEEVYDELAEELRIPIIYDIDCGHLPPQITFINGAYAEIETSDGKGTVLQHFR